MTRVINLLPAGGGGGAQGMVPVATGTYITQAVNGIAPTASATAADRLECFPLRLGMDYPCDQIAFEVTTASAGNARIGIYADNNGAPGALLVGGVTNHDVSTTGVKTETVSITLAKGTLYWLAHHASAATPQYRANQVAGALSIGSAAGGASGGYTSRRANSVTYASGLPPTAPTTTLTAGAIVPMIYLRRA